VKEPEAMWIETPLKAAFKQMHVMLEPLDILDGSRSGLPTRRRLTTCTTSSIHGGIRARL